MDLNDFVKICDDAINSISGTDKNQVFNAPHADLYKKITEICGKNCNAVRLLTGLLIKELAISHICNQHKTSPYHEILKILRDAARSESDDKGDIDAVEWKELISTIYQNRNSSHFFDQGSIYFDKQDMDLAHSCKNISARGIKIDFLHGSPVISDSSHQKISEEIDSICREIGGIQIIKQTLSSIKNLYHPDLDRFLIYRAVSMGVTTVNAATPYGYLISLGLKYLNIRGQNKSKSQDQHNELCAYLRDIISIFEIQPYNMWEATFIGANNFMPFLQDSVIYDNMVAFPQIKSKYAKAIIKGVLQPFINENYETEGVQLRHIYLVSLALIDLSKETEISSASIKEIVKLSKLPKDEVKSILDKFLSHEKGMPNNNLNFPPLNTNIDANFKPAFKDSDGTYLLMPKCITALAAMNSTLNLISQPGREFDNTSDGKLGMPIEDLLRRAFKCRGIQTKEGKFTISKSDQGECDLIVETANNIFLFEIKKKQLTRKALSGFEPELLFDCADSFLRSQSQAIKTEWFFRKNGILELEDSCGQKNSIHLNSRNIERISLSLNDFGSLHDRQVFQTIMNAIISIEISSQDSSVNSRLKNWKKYVEKISKYCLLIEGQNPQAKGHPFKNSAFMSVSQLFTILDGCHSAHDFEKEIMAGRNITRGTRDFYVEYVCNKHLSAHKS